MKSPLKLYIVKREVLARNIKEAMNNRGTIYGIELAADTLQPVIKNPFNGLAPKNKCNQKQ